MGCISPKNKSHRVDSTIQEVNRFFYFSRVTKTLYEVTSEQVLEFKLKGEIEAYRDSAISTLDTDKIVVIGGSNFYSELTNQVYLIDCSTVTIHDYGKTPVSTKDGHILVKGNTLYFVGTTIEANEHSGLFIGGPVMIYSLSSHEWTVIPPEKISKNHFYSLARNKKTNDEINLDQIDFNLNSIISPGVFMYDERLYYVGGRIFDGNEYVPSKKVFSLGINEWDLRLEPFSLPVTLINPLCINKGHVPFIVGGFLENGKPNLDIFNFKAKSNDIQQYAKSFETSLEENYSPQIIHKDIIFHSIPKFWIIPEESNDLISYTVSKSPGDIKESVRRTFNPSSSSIEAQYIQVNNRTLTVMEFVASNGDYLSDNNGNQVLLFESGMINLASTAFHVDENLTIICKPLLRKDISSNHKIIFKLNRKTAVFTLESHFLHPGEMTLNFEHLLDRKDPPSPIHWASPVTINKVHYTNWSRTITANKIWTAAPKNFEEVELICNWGMENEYLIRPRGVIHGWSPLTILNQEKAKVLLVDLTKFPGPMKFNSSGPYGPCVTVSAGTTLGELLKFLEQQQGTGEAPGWSFPHTPAPAHLTIGGVLAINAHGSAIPVETENFQVSYGSLSNHILELWAVVTDPKSSNPKRYIVKKFDRKDKDIKAFLAHLGRTIVVQVTLKVIPNYNLRCQSLVNLSFETLFAEPVNGKNPENSIGYLAERAGRVEVIGFPFTEYPWTKVWTHEAEIPIGSVKVENMNNYPFSDSYPDYITDLLKKVTSIPEVTPPLCQIMSKYTNFELVQQNLTDLWGPSKNTLIYIRDQTLRVTANGYAIHMNRKYIQQACYLFYKKFDQLIKKYDAKGQWPINSPLEIRITGLDKNEFIFDNSDDEFNRPVISALAYSQLDKERNWDVAVWLDILTIPGTKYSDKFYAEFENWLDDNFNDENAKIFVEWSKGWAYTEKMGAWTDGNSIQSIRNAFTEGRARDDNWKWQGKTLEKYDSGNIFYSGLNRVLFS